MSPISTLPERNTWRDTRIISCLFLIAFLTRMPLINWYNAEYTDAVFYITVYYNKTGGYLPLYGLLIEPLYDLFGFIPTYEIAGRFISILAGSLSVIPIYLAGKHIFNEKTGVYGVLLYIFSAMALRWDLRVMTDSLFTLMFLLSLYGYMKFYYEPKARWLFMGFFFAGMATLARYQGMGLLLFMALLCLRELRAKRYRLMLYSLPAISSWLAVLWWVYQRGFGQQDGFTEKTKSLYLVAQMLKEYLLILPYAMTYPVFALFCYGAYKAWKLERGRLFLYAFATLFVPWLIIHTSYMDLVSRYFMPLFPFFMILAAYAITLFKREKAVLVISLAISIGFSVAVLYYQRDSFGDIKRAAVWVRDNVKQDETVYATDKMVFKTMFWSRRKVLDYEQNKTILQPGDYIILQSFYVPIETVMGRLSKVFYLKTMYETESVIVPLLPDLTNPTSYTTDPRWREVQYKKNHFNSKVIKVLARKTNRGSAS